MTLNPIVLGSISGAGVLLKTYREIKSYKKKIEPCRFAYTSHEKILVDLYSFMRGKSYDDQDYLTQVRVIVDIIIDMCPLVDKWDKEYSQKFISE